MTGEMGWNDVKDYPDMIALAKKIQTGVKVGAQVRPFDTYQGPFVAVDLDRTPVRNAQKIQFSSWNVEVWYTYIVGKFTVKYAGHTKPITPAEVVKKIKEIKLSRDARRK